MARRNQAETPDTAERRATQAERVAAAAPAAVLNAADFVEALTRGKHVREDDGRPIPEIVRTKIRTIKSQGHPAFLTFTKEQLAEPAVDQHGRSLVGRQFRFGDTVYLKRDAFLFLRRTGMVDRGD